MIFTPTELKDALIIDPEIREDARGFFARIWCQDELGGQGINTNVVQVNMSYSRTRGTLRGMHYQRAPHAETKLVRCTMGAIYDVIVDIRLGSPTYLRWIGVELSAQNHRMLYIPEGFAHGFQTLTDDVEVTYQVTAFYTPSAEGGARYNDPAFGITWPLDVTVISDKDRSWADFA